MYALQLNPAPPWKAAPGCRILIVDGGAVRFDFPREWLVFATSKHICLADVAPPHDRCWIGVSWRRIAQDLPLTPSLLIEEITGEIADPFRSRGNIVRFFRPPLEGAWTETRFADAADPAGEPVRTRICIARSDATQALILFDYRLEREALAERVWETLLATLAVGDYVDDIATGRRRMQRG